MKNWKLVGLLLCTGLLSACAGKLEKVPSSQLVTQPAPGKALVYFLRPATVIAATYAIAQRVPTDAPLYDNDQFIGAPVQNTHLAYQAEPGKHLFMVLGEYPDFLRAELVAGKIYYIKVHAWPNEARFELHAHNGQFAPTDLNLWVTQTTQVALTDKGRAWAAANGDKAAKARAKNFPAWESRMARNVREAELRTLRPESGK